MYKNIKNNHLVIMAGGVGSRFWPMSTPDYPFCQRDGRAARSILFLCVDGV